MYAGFEDNVGLPTDDNEIEEMGSNDAELYFGVYDYYKSLQIDFEGFYIYLIIF